MKIRQKNLLSKQQRTQYYAARHAVRDEQPFKIHRAIEDVYQGLLKILDFPNFSPFEFVFNPEYVISVLEQIYEVDIELSDTPVHKHLEAASNYTHDVKNIKVFNRFKTEVNTDSRLSSRATRSFIDAKLKHKLYHIAGLFINPMDAFDKTRDIEDSFMSRLYRDTWSALGIDIFQDDLENIISVEFDNNIKSSSTMGVLCGLNPEIVSIFFRFPKARTSNIIIPSECMATDEKIQPFYKDIQFKKEAVNFYFNKSQHNIEYYLDMLTDEVVNQLTDALGACSQMSKTDGFAHGRNHYEVSTGGTMYRLSMINYEDWNDDEEVVVVCLAFKPLA